MPSRARLHTFFRYFPVSARDRRWGLWLTTAGESQIPPGTQYPPEGHPGGYSFDWTSGRALREFQIVYISAGAGTLQTSGRVLREIRSGDVFILFPGMWHSYRPDPEIGWNEHWVGCDGPIIRGLMKNGFVDVSKPVLKTQNEDLLMSAFSTVIEAIHANRPALQQIMAGLTLYILSLLYSAQQPGQDSGLKISTAIQKAIRSMATSPLDRHIELESMARDVNMSYTWFRRAFTQHTGLSPHQYRLQLRIARARTLLTNTQMTVKQVAFQSGFRSDHYFCRLFKAKTGMTPEEWRHFPAT